MQKETKKFTTVNNWICKEFIHCIIMSKWRQCCFIIYNTFDHLDDDIACRMLDYFVNAVDPGILHHLYITLPIAVRDCIIRKIYNRKEVFKND